MLDFSMFLARVFWNAVSLLVRTLGRAAPAPWSLTERWQEAASAAALTDVELSRDGLSGSSGLLRVRLSRFAEEELTGTRITISGPGLHPTITVRPERTHALVRASETWEIVMGDPDFDRAAWVEGPPAAVRALLDADLRRVFRGLFEGRLERPRLAPYWAKGWLEAGVLRVDVPDVLPLPGSDLGALFVRGTKEPEETARDVSVGGREDLAGVLRIVLQIAVRLMPPADVPRRLAENLAREPEAGVRVQLLGTLAREFSYHPATRGALLAACEDPNAEVRLHAGIALGSDGRDVLLRLARGEGAEDATTERAVQSLGETLTEAEVEPILRDALRMRRKATARACLERLGRLGRPEATAMAARVLAVEQGELAAAAADALGSTRDRSAEPALLEALRRRDPETRLAAARALGHVGTVAAVEPLKSLEAQDSETRVAARQAIAEIQSRLTGAAPGQLSLAASEAGGLSLVAEESGRLSLADGAHGRLSLVAGEPGNLSPRNRGEQVEPRRSGQR